MNYEIQAKAVQTGINIGKESLTALLSNITHGVSLYLLVETQSNYDYLLFHANIVSISMDRCP